VTFAGPDLHAFASDGRDQSLSLFLPRPGQSEPVLPMDYGEGWRQAWIDTPEDVRAVMRSYTLRALRQDTHGATTEIDIDFVLHGTEPGTEPGAEPDTEPGASGAATLAGSAGPAGPAGPASRWAAGAGAGDRAVLLGPSVADNGAIRFRPPADADLVVVWADETALPAASAILETLPAGTRARVWLEVPSAGDCVRPVTAANAEITWLVRDEGAPTAVEAIRAAQLPATQAPYAWIAGESGRVKELRRHLVREREIDRKRVTFVGYWRRGLSEEQLREQGR
jgi:NADPH-dependent ferric siderophore reductase